APTRSWFHPAGLNQCARMFGEIRVAELATARGLGGIEPSGPSQPFGRSHEHVESKLDVLANLLDRKVDQSSRSLTAGTISPPSSVSTATWSSVILNVSNPVASFMPNGQLSVRVMPSLATSIAPSMLAAMTEEPR